MTVLTSAHHLDEAVPGLPVAGVAVTAELPDGDVASRLLVLYEQVAAAVVAALGGGRPPTVVAGDCTTSLAVLAGLQRAGVAPGIVWIDAHGDFNTPETTESGYLGGMPLAIAVGHDAFGLGASLGLQPVPEDRVVLAGARDLDAAEAALLASSAVTRAGIDELGAQTLPPGPIYLHIDVDVIDAAAVTGLLFAVAAGPSVEDLAAAIGRVLYSGRVAAVGLACTWRPDALMGAAAREVVARLGLPL